MKNNNFIYLFEYYYKYNGTNIAKILFLTNADKIS